jgi:glycosyltransferase involved in cell wall biosynthesis
MRPYGWFKYLDKNIWEVTIVTRQWADNIVTPTDCVRPSHNQETIIEINKFGRIFSVPYRPNYRDKLSIKHGIEKKKFIRKFLSFFLNFLKFQFFAFDITSEIYFESRRLLSNEKFDVIMATGEPFLLFKYAHLLSREFLTPWVSDYRDGWTNNQEERKMNFKELLLRFFYKQKEKKYLSNSSLITTASPTYKKKLEIQFPHKMIEVVYNGFFGDELPDFKKKDNPIFTIAYAGTLYPHQPIESFLNAIYEFIVKNQLTKEQFRVVFYGMNFNPEQKRRVGLCNPFLEPFLEFTFKINYAELIAKLNEAHILLLLSRNGLNWLNAKVFDYIAADRRVLLYENDHGILEKLLEKSGNMLYVCDKEIEVVEILNSAYTEYKESGMLPNRNTDKEQFTRENQSLILSKILLDLIKK